MDEKIIGKQALSFDLLPRVNLSRSAQRLLHRRCTENAIESETRSENTGNLTVGATGRANQCQIMFLPTSDVIIT